MATTYTVLTGAQTVAGSIKRLLNNPTVDPDEILELAQAEIYARLRTREMRTEATLTLAQGDLYVALPSSFLDPISLTDRFQKEIYLVDAPDLASRRSKDASDAWIQAEPRYYAIWDERVQFEVAMNAARTFTMFYFKTPAALASGTQTNFLTARYPHLLRAAIRWKGYEWLKQSAEAKEAMADCMRTLEAIAVQDDLSNRGFVPSERGYF